MSRVALVASAVCLISSLAAAGEAPVSDRLTLPGRAVKLSVTYVGKPRVSVVPIESVTYLIKVKNPDSPRIDSNMPTYAAPRGTRYDMLYYSDPGVKPLAAPKAAAPSALGAKVPSALARLLKRAIAGNAAGKS